MYNKGSKCQNQDVFVDDDFNSFDGILTVMRNGVIFPRDRPFLLSFVPGFIFFFNRCAGLKYFLEDVIL